MEALEELSRAAVNDRSDAPAMEFEGIWYSWGELSRIAGEAERLLEAAGIREGMPIAFVPRNRPWAIAAELGMIAGRYSVRMIYAFQQAAGIARDVAKANVCAVVAGSDDFTPELLEVAKANGLAAIALGADGAKAITGFERCAANFTPQTGEPYIELLTSGTTGAPKPVRFPFDTIRRYIVGQNVFDDGGRHSDEIPVLLTFPLGNISGIYSTLPSLLKRRRSVLADRFTLDVWRDYVRRYQPAAPGVPPAAVRMILDADVPKEELTCIKSLLTGAAPLDPTVQKAFEEKYGIPVLLSYGATEFGGVVTLMTPQMVAEFGGTKHLSVGRPYAGSELRVIDPETEAVLPPGTSGLLEVKTPRIGDHWIRTTDIGMIDADGFLYHQGRADGAIMRGGFKLLPEVIGRALCEHPAVAAAAVVGVRDARLGQVPAAMVQTKAGHAQPTIAELEQHLRQLVYATHIPTIWKFVDSLPRNASYKTDLAAVRGMLEPAASAG